MWRGGTASIVRCMAMALPLVATGCVDKADLPRQIARGDPAEGLKVIERVGCAACHTVPGVRWPQGRTGGSLAGVGARPLIAGRLPNQPDTMIAFVRDAPSLLHDTAMPPMPLPETEARDVAAYLYTLDDD